MGYVFDSWDMFLIHGICLHNWYPVSLHVLFFSDGRGLVATLWQKIPVIFFILLFFFFFVILNKSANFLELLTTFL